MSGSRRKIQDLGGADSLNVLNAAPAVSTISFAQPSTSTTKVPTQMSPKVKEDGSDDVRFLVYTTDNARSPKAMKNMA
jgi:hypothetical protein